MALLAQAFDEAQSVDNVLLRLRLEGCRSVANALPAASPGTPAANLEDLTSGNVKLQRLTNTMSSITDARFLDYMPQQAMEYTGITALATRLMRFIDFQSYLYSAAQSRHTW